MQLGVLGFPNRFRNQFPPLLSGRKTAGLLGLLAVTMAILVGLGGTVFGQRLDGTLRGVVQDPQAAMITGAKVTATNQETNVSQSTTTTSAGTFVFPSLPVGKYRVTIEKQGFQKYTRSDVEVSADRVVDVNAALPVGSETTTVEVTAGSELVQTSSSTLANTFSGRVVTDLPISTVTNGAGSGVLELATQFPNTTTQGGGVIGTGGSVGGARPRMNGFTIDGVDDNRVDITGPLSTVITDAIAEFTLVQNQFSAEYGHSAGGLFEIVTKSGTNSWHGEGHEYNRNRDLFAMDNLEKSSTDANGNPLTQPRRYDYNKFGGSIGGPIIKDRFFIFGAYERTQRGRSATSSDVIAPTAAGLSTLEGLAANPTIANFLTFFPVAATPDPTISNPINGVPVEYGHFQAAAPDFYNQHDFNINGDLNLNKHAIRVRYLYDRYRTPNQNPELPVAMFAGDVAQDSRKVIVTDAITLTNRLILDLRGSFSRFVQAFTVPPNGVAGSFSYPGGPFPNIEIDPNNINVGPEGNSPQSYSQNLYQLGGGLAYTKGRHSLKFGVEGRRWIAPSSFLPRARGEWDYADFSTFINDQIPNGSNGALRGAGLATFNGNQSALYWYAQDDLKLTPRLTLNLGLRYEWTGEPAGASLQAINAISNLDTTPAIVQQLTGIKSFNFHTPKSDKNNFSPRFGFAYDPTGSGKWSIRGGGMVAYDVSPQNFALLQLPPQLQTEQNPDLSCQVQPTLAYCPTGATPGTGFLQAGGLVTVNVPPVTQTDARAATQGYIVDQTQPKMITWTLGVQHELFRNTSVELRYLGTRGLSLPVQFRFNTIGGNTVGLPNLPVYLKASDIPAAVPNPTVTRANWEDFQNCVDPTNPLLCDAPLVQSGFLTFFTAFPPLGQSTYHAGSVDVIHRMAHGLYIRGNYTFSKNIDNSTNELFSSRVNPRRPEDPYNLSLDRGLSALHVKNKAAISWVYDFPTLHSENGFAKVLMNGWNLTGSWLAQNGQPITPQSGTDSNGSGDSAGDHAFFNPTGTVLAGGNNKMDAVCNNGPGGATSVMSISACIAAGGGTGVNVVGYTPIDPTRIYLQAPLGAFATAGRNVIISPGFNVFNLSAAKTTKIGERVSLRLGAEAYDLFNHRNFTLGNPSVFEVDANALSTSYANVTSSDFLNAKQFNGGSRQMQLDLKITF